MARRHGRSSASVGAASGGLDPLSDVLRVVRLAGACFFRVEASSPWWAEVPDASAIAGDLLPRAQHLVSYHVVTSGRCWAGLADGTALWAEEGDVLVVPHGDAYALATAPGPVGRQPVAAARAFFRALAAGELPPTVVEGGGGRTRVGVVCGFLGCDAAPYNPVLALLPRLVKVSPPPPPARDRLAPLVRMAIEEARADAPGSADVLLRIGELMFVEIARRLAAARAPSSGWLAALREPAVGRALGLLHREPARGWTLAALARAAGLSRSTLAERFTASVGQPPMQYLARWRMQLAARLLADGTAKVAAVAREVGYESEASFSRAFRKATGEAPSSWRARCRQGEPRAAAARPPRPRTASRRAR
jgi:AraC-like DNA-binding protein